MNWINPSLSLIRDDDDNDDLPVGRILNRKEVLTLIGGAGLALLSGCGGSASPVTSASTAPTDTTGTTATPTPTVAATATPTPTPTATPIATTCVAMPELTEGPYFVDERLDRSDIRLDPSDGSTVTGVPLSLKFVVADVTDGCALVSGAQVDLWHCDASGSYSDVSANSTVGRKFLRGYQNTDASGVANFTTIYPGWYAGRAVHMHLKVRFTSGGQTYTLTSQLFFDDTLTDTVYRQSPYSSRGTRGVRNATDSIYRSGGSSLVLNLTPSGAGYTATFIIGVTL